jgi:hypothetical protein
LLHGLIGYEARNAPFGKCRECHANAQINKYGECYHCEMEQEVYRLREKLDNVCCLVEEAAYFLTEIGVPKDGHERAWLIKVGEMNSYLRAELERIEEAKESDG